MMRLLLALSFFFLAGFHPAASFEKSANQGGGGDLFYTGALRGKGYDCAICHVDPAAQIAIELVSEPPLAGAYTPGVEHAITLTMVGEHRGFGAVANRNTFLAEVVTDADVSAGSFAADLDRFELVDGDRVLASAAGAETTWSFTWQAPAAGAGALTFHVGIVDGDGAGDPVRASTDPNGDDVAMLALRLCEGDPGCADRPRRERDDSAAAGCSTAGGGLGTAALVLIALAALHRRRALVLLFALAGCFDPKTPAECPDRVCGQDPGDDEPDAGPPCAESWECSSWEAPLGSDQATRTCTDRNDTGTTECKPSEGPVTLPALDLDYYKCRVSPIIQRGCSMMGCHGTDTGRPFRTYARGRLRNDQIVDRTGSCIPATGQVNLQEAGTGTVMCEGWLPHTDEEWKKNFDSARSFMLGVTDPADSDMLLMPVVGGKPHIEIKLFRDTDADYATIRDWLAGATLGQTCNTGVN